MTAPTLIYEQAQGEPPRVFAIAEATRDITAALDAWAKRWLALGWQVQRADGGWTAAVVVAPGQFFERQVWAEIDPAICAEQLRAVLPGWLVDSSTAPAGRDSRDIAAPRGRVGR